MMGTKLVSESSVTDKISKKKTQKRFILLVLMGRIRICIRYLQGTLAESGTTTKYMQNVGKCQMLQSEVSHLLIQGI